MQLVYIEPMIFLMQPKKALSITIEFSCQSDVKDCLSNIIYECLSNIIYRGAWDKINIYIYIHRIRGISLMASK